MSGCDCSPIPRPPTPGAGAAVVALRGDDGEDGAPGVAFAAGLSLANGNLFQVDTDGTTTTTSAAFVVGQTLTAVLGAGLWRVDWYAEFLNNTVGVSTNVETQLDGVTVGTIRQGEDVDALDTEIHSGFCLRVLTNGSHTATIRFSSNGAATATLRRRRLVFIRLG